MAERASGGRAADEQSVTPDDVGQPPDEVTATAEAGPEPDEFPYGGHQCPECGASVSRLHPGFPDPDARDRETVCPDCGHRFKASRKTLAKARD